MFADLYDRDENTKRPLPRRLQELVAQYPYTTSPDPTTDGLLTRPRFSTRRHGALFVRVEAVYTDNARFQSSPVNIFTDALKSEPNSDSGGYVYLWDQVKAAATSDSDDKPLPTILSDDTINLLSLVSTDPKELALLGISGAASTVVTPLSPVMETLPSPTANGNGIPIPVRKSTLPPSTPQSPKDWAEFSSAGFGETTISHNFASTLLDKDVEVTEPPVQRRPSKLRQNRNTTTPTESGSPAPNPKAPEELEGPKLFLAATEIVQLDEAFIDFWRDAVVDPVSNDWPKFVIGELKHPLTPRSISTSSEDGEKVSPGSPISWIIIEEKFRRPTPPPTPVVSHEPLPATSGLKVAATPPKRTSSPRPSFGEKKTSLSATFKRFTLFGGSKDDLTEDANSTASGSAKKDSLSGRRKRLGVGKSPVFGEMGEALSEESEPKPEVPKKVGAAESVLPKEGAKEELTGMGATMKDDGLSAPQDGAPSAFVPKESKTEVETLPPAPESVVSHGETPGPQLVLDSTEAGLHHLPESATHTAPAGVPEETADFGVPSPGPTVEHLEDKVEDPAANVGVDLDPVPIVPNDPVEPVEVPEPVTRTVPEPEPQPVVTKDSLPLSPNGSASEEREKATTSTQSVPSGPEPADIPSAPQHEEKVAMTDVPVVESAPDG